jgi:hypothetical protein
MNTNRILWSRSDPVCCLSERATNRYAKKPAALSALTRVLGRPDKPSHTDNARVEVNDAWYERELARATQNPVAEK